MTTKGSGFVIHNTGMSYYQILSHNSYVNATVSLVRRYGAVVCMKNRELTQDPDCTLALQHVLDLLTWASYPGQIFPVWTQVNISNDNLMMCNTWTTDPGTICEHGLKFLSSCTSSVAVPPRDSRVCVTPQHMFKGAFQQCLSLDYNISPWLHQKEQ